MSTVHSPCPALHSSKSDGGSFVRSLLPLALVVLSVTQYIRNLGYQAIASMNDTSLAIPYALKAGLGEYGRHGLLITKEFGPRVRLGKITPIYRWRMINRLALG